MTVTKLALLLVCLMSFAVESKQTPKATPVEAKVTPVMSKDLPNLPGKEGLMLFVEYPPGSSDPIHRHNANAFVYVLEIESLNHARQIISVGVHLIAIPRLA